MDFYGDRMDRLLEFIDNPPWKRHRKSRGPKRRLGYNINAYVFLEEDFDVNKSTGSSDKYPVNLYLILKFRERDSQFYEYQIVNVRPWLVLEKWYREEELYLLGGNTDNTVREIFMAWRGGEDPSSRENEWDAKTLVDRDNADRDDETLRGDDD